MFKKLIFLVLLLMPFVAADLATAVSPHQACIDAGRDPIDCQGESTEDPDAESEDEGGGGGGGGTAQSPQERSEAGQEALNAFVKPTSTSRFSLSLVNSDREAGLYIGNDNGEGNVIFRLIRLIAMMVGTIAILLYIVGAYFMIISSGEENLLTKGKQIVTYTTMGLALTFGAYMIVQFILGMLYFSG